MKRKFLAFANGQQKRGAGYAHACHKEGGDGGGTGGAGASDDDDDDDTIVDDDPEKEKKVLFKEIEKRIGKEIEKRKYLNKEAITGIITSTLKDVNIENLRNFDGKKVAESVKNIAGELEKFKNMPSHNGTENRANPLKDMLNDEKIMKRIETVFRSREVGPTVVLNVRAAAIMTMPNAIDDAAVVAIGDDVIESFSIDSFAKKRRPKEYIFDLISRKTVAELSEYKTWLEEGGEEGAFAIVAEGAVKPLVSKSLIRNVSKYKKVAGKRIYTEEFTKFRKEAYAILEDLFNDQLMRNYAALLMVDVLAKASAYVATALDGQYTAPTDYHAIGAVAAQIESLDFEPDTLFINPQDKWRIALEQDNTGRFFLNIPTVNPDGTITMMGFRVFTSNRIDVGEFILGESRLYKVEDEPVTIRMGYGINVVTDVNGFVTSVTSDFDTNQFRIIAETFFHSYIPSNFIGSFVKANFADMKEALLNPAA